MTVWNYLKKVGYAKKLDVWVDRISISETLLKLNEIDPFLKQITGDEKWVKYKNIVRKRSWNKRGKPPQTTSKPGLKEAIKEKRPELINRKGVVFHHDNARSHTSLMTRKLRELGWEVLMHPPLKMLIHFLKFNINILNKNHPSSTSKYTFLYNYFVTTFIFIYENDGQFIILILLRITNYLNNLLSHLTPTANIIAGHLLLTLLGLSRINIFNLAILLLIFTQILFYILEISVSIIQAYVLSILSTFYNRET
ncbi:SETMR methyltransferase, partial [Acromyrmex insinuator]